MIGKRFLLLPVVVGVLAVAGLSGGASAEELPKKIPVAVTADKLDYDRASDVYTAVGHVKIEQQNIRLEADRLSSKVSVFKVAVQPSPSRSTAAA
jgi:lipopolysaccharide export system protein LptA